MWSVQYFAGVSVYFVMCVPVDLHVCTRVCVCVCIFVCVCSYMCVVCVCVCLRLCVMQRRTEKSVKSWTSS